MVLEGIISQSLLPKIGGGRVMACEILVATMAMRALIRDDKIHQIQGIMEIGQKFGMQTMNSELLKLFNKRLISKKDALTRSPEPDQMAKLIDGN